MRTRSLAFLAATALSLVACAAEQGDDAESQDSNVTGGSGSVESPVLFLFDANAATDTKASPKCAGAMLGDKIGVTAKACAKEGMVVGRAADKDGRGKRAKITKVISPDEADADIAVIELDTSLGGTRALLTHLPLRDGYSVHAFAATDGKGLFAPDKGEASSVKGAILEQSATHATIIPAKGSEICDGDIGAPVCSTTGTHLAGFEIRGTCGLSGLVVGRASAATTTTTTTNTATASTDAPKTCSGEGWKVVELGRYADFLKEHAPDAFKPLVIDKPILRNFPYAPEGLWDYKTGGTVASCSVQTQSLTPVAKSTASGKITAKVAFTGLDKNAQAWARVGIAPKADPKNVRWFSAKALTTAKGASFEQSFEGAVIAEADGDYVVSVRTSANGGETWTECDKTLALKVGLETAPSETPPSTSNTPQSDTPPPSGYSDPPADGESTPAESGEGDPASSEEEDPAPKKKASDSGGCSVSHTSSGSSAISLGGMLFAFALIARRRRR